MPEPTENQREHADRRLPFPLPSTDIFSLTKGGFILAGSATLASGTVAVSDRRIQPSSVALVSYTVPGGTTGTNLKAVCTAGTLTITAVGTGGATVTTDTSTVVYLVILAART